MNEATREALESLKSAGAVTEEAFNNLHYGLNGEDGPYQKTILFAMNKLRMPIYSGTVKPEEVARRRKANKAARESRRNNRK